MLDPKFLEVLKANGWKTTALAAACLTIYLLVERDLIRTDDLWRSLPLTGLIIFGFLSLSSILEAVFKFAHPIMNLLNDYIRIYSRKKSLIKQIPFMTNVEKEIIAYLIHHNQKSFEAEITGDRASTLIAKGIIRPAHKHTQLIAFDAVPFEMPDYAWDVFYKRRDQFPYVPAKHGGYPWSTRSMARI